MHWPRISIVTVCLNQADSVARTLRSVLDQAYPALEYVVIDGGSRDGTVAIVDRYVDRLAGWVTEPDHGQSHALNKGFARTTGDILGWLNGDDWLLPGALETVGRFFRDHPDVDVVCGACRYVYDDGSHEDRRVDSAELAYLDVYDPIHQPSCFWRRALHDRVGPLNEDLRFGMDWDLFLRFARAGARFAAIPDVLSAYQFGRGNKTTTGGDMRNAEMYRILCTHPVRAPLLRHLAYHVMWPLKRLRRVPPRWLTVRVSNFLRTGLLLGLGPLFGFGAVRRATHPFS